MVTSFSVLIPYFNEEDFLPQTLRCWLDQTRLPDELILVDNASTDTTTQQCKSLLESHPQLSVTFLEEHRPGKVHALETGLKYVQSTFVVFADADTYYPPHYLALGEELIEERPKNLMAVMALNSSGIDQTIPRKLKRQFYVGLSKVLQRQSYTGNFGQILHTETLRKAGGFSEAQWPYMMRDHEVMHRLFRYGRAYYHPDLWCYTSPRRGDRKNLRWTLFERLLYFVTPYGWKDWFFYKFLAGRFEKRKLYHINLRAQPWKETSSEPPEKDRE